MFRLKGLNFVIIFLSFFSAIEAQNIVGKIVDRNGSPIPGAVIKLENTDYEQLTNAAGNFRFINIPKGNYSITSGQTDVVFQKVEVKLEDENVNVGTISTSNSVETGNSSNDITVVSVDDLQQIDDDASPAVSSALNSSRDPFLAAAAFNLSNGRFRARGYNNEETELYLNGMYVNDLDDGNVFWNSWGGLNDVTRSQTNSLSLMNTDFAFGGVGGAAFVDLRASVQRVQNKVLYANSNRSFNHRISYTKSSGMQENGWAYSFSLSKRWAESGYIKGTHFDSYSYYAAVDRKLNAKQTLGLVILGAPLRRGKNAPTVQEMHDLSGNNFYNPNWGYQNGEVRNAREDRIHQPIAMLRHDYKINQNTKLVTTVGYQFGKYGNTRLDWYKAADPRPDYYRKLPSYAESEIAKAALLEHFKDEKNRQLNFDELYEVNNLRVATIKNVGGIEGNDVTGKSSAYIIEEQRFDVTKLNFNSVLNTQFTNTLTFNAGLNYSKERSHNFKVVDDLLGGDFYVDSDDFAERDFPGNAEAQQNDLNNPNRLAKQGDVFAYDYDLNTQDIGSWIQLSNVGNKNDAFIAVKANHVSFFREGFMKNGRFPDNSFGKSSTINFNTLAVKAGNTFKLNGRNYFYVAGEYKTRAPFSRYAYLSPRQQDKIVANLQTEKITSGEVGYIFKFNKLKGRITGYVTEFKDQIENNSFYHDDLGLFVNYVLSDIQKRHTGIEFGTEFKYNTRFSFEAALALGQYYYTNRPNATVVQDNNGSVIIDRQVYINNYFVSGSPQTAGTFGINYNDPKYWWININLNYFANSYVDINPERRTDLAVELLDPNENSELFHSIIDQEKLPSAMTVDFYGGKSFKWGKYYLVCNLNVGNVLNKKDFRTGGFEQYRYDYQEKDVSNFPPKYFYAFGRNYNFSVSLSF